MPLGYQGSLILGQLTQLNAPARARARVIAFTHRRQEAVVANQQVGGGEMFVSDALEKKGTDVITTDPDISIADTARTLKGKGIGAIVVMGETGVVAGIISERDIIHGIAMHGNRALDMPVWELMTDEVVTCRRNDTINQALQQMVDHSCRHLPVVEDGELKGLVSMSDVVKLRMEELQSLIAESKISEPDDDADAWPVKD